VPAATARREAVTAQLTNVRQMIAALGAGPLLDVIGEDSASDEPTELSSAAFEDALTADAEDDDDDDQFDQGEALLDLLFHAVPP